MENITEVLVKKKKNGTDELKSFFVVLLGFILVAVSAKYLGAFSVIAVALIIYLAYRLLLSFDMEFEYCLVDKEIRVDKILSKKKRKDYIRVEGDEIEYIAKLSDVGESELKNTKIYMASEFMNASDNYVVKANKGGVAMSVVIKGDERVLAHLKRVMPGKVR
ncbi:MAG: hypothetical protein IJE10_02950 [Clostridia bacterium]|nr:hypothetical protein [Clostridia bacterium]